MIHFQKLHFIETHSGVGSLPPASSGRDCINSRVCVLTLGMVNSSRIRCPLCCGAQDFRDGDEGNCDDGVVGFPEDECCRAESYRKIRKIQVSSVRPTGKEHHKSGTHCGQISRTSRLKFACQEHYIQFASKKSSKDKRVVNAHFRWNPTPSQDPWPRCLPNS